jgi:hypothetical protein
MRKNTKRKRRRPKIAETEDHFPRLYVACYSGIEYLHKEPEKRGVGRGAAD